MNLVHPTEYSKVNKHVRVYVTPQSGIVSVHPEEKLSKHVHIHFWKLYKLLFRL